MNKHRAQEQGDDCADYDKKCVVAHYASLLLLLLAGASIQFDPLVVRGSAVGFRTCRSSAP
jgi:hypothetical protein